MTNSFPFSHFRFPIMKDIRMEESWKAQLSSEFQKPYFRLLTDFVRQEYSTVQCFPPARLIFNAFDQTPFHEVKVSSWDKTPIMATDRHTGFVSPFRTALPFRLRSGISSRRYRQRRERLCRRVATSPVGLGRECSCSTHASASGHTRHSAIRARGGRHSPMPS